MCVGPTSSKRPQQVKLLCIPISRDSTALNPIRATTSSDVNSEDRQSQNRRPTQSRQVTFDAEDDDTIKINVMGPPFTPASKMTAEEKAKIWWGPSNLDYFKKSARGVSWKVEKLQKADRDPYSYSRVLLRTYNASCSTRESRNSSKAEIDRKYFELWARNGHYGRGLERQNIPIMGRDRLKRKHVAIHGVLEVQKLLKARTEIDRDMRAETIRLASEQLSR